MENSPKFHNEVGAPIVRIGCHEMIAVGDRAAKRWHLQFAERWVVHFNFYVNDERWGRMFVRMCPKLHSQHRSQLDRLYQRVVDDLDKLIQAVGLKAA